MWYSTPTTPELPSLWHGILQLREKESFFKVCKSYPPTKQHCKVHSTAYDKSGTSDDFFIGMVHCTTTKIPDLKLEGIHSCKPPKNLPKLTQVHREILFPKDDITDSVQYCNNSHTQDVLHLVAIFAHVRIPLIRLLHVLQLIKYSI